MRIQSKRLVAGALVATILSISNVTTIHAQSTPPSGPTQDCATLKKTDYEAFKAQCVKHTPIGPDLNTLASPGGPVSEPTCIISMLPAEFPKWARVEVAVFVCGGPCTLAC
jgi:hypothetical protein